SHPSLGQYVISGEGIGTVTVTMSTDRTAHDVAADGSVMVSKIEGDNGTLAIQIQQTSGANQWLVNAFNYLRTASPSEWAQMSATIRSPYMGDLVTATGVSFQQRAELSYQAQGQQRTWNLMAASITETNVA
uniref:phage protein n=1 Tax=Alicyclobacillus suci TaxID=2816080 RepID=UPI001A8D7F4F